MQQLKDTLNKNNKYNLTNRTNRLIENKYIKSISPISNYKSISNKTDKKKKVTKKENQIVDNMLTQYSDLIDSNYKNWFAKKFYSIPAEQVHRFAQVARLEGENPQAYFCYQIKNYTGHLA